MDMTGLPYQVLPMTEDDLDAVMAIEEMSFSLPWSARAYRYELNENDAAHLFVVRPRAPSALTGSPARLWDRVRYRLGRARSQRMPLVGYACLWLMVDEAHISTIAVHPEWRRLGIGNLLLYTLLRHAQAQEAQVVTLEVRVSNTAAQALYAAWGFQTVGRRRRYYSDTGEDALIMTTPPLTSPDFQSHIEGRRRVLVERLRAIPPVPR